MDWFVKHWDELTRDELYDLLAVRTAVFVVEQRCPYQEADGLTAGLGTCLSGTAEGQFRPACGFWSRSAEPPRSAGCSQWTGGPAWAGY